VVGRERASQVDTEQALLDEDEGHRLDRGQYQEHGGQVANDVRGEQCTVHQLDRRAAAAAQQAPGPGGMQVEAFQQQHREEQPCLIAGQPAADSVPGPGLVPGDGDRPATDVRGRGRTGWGGRDAGCACSSTIRS
jgi:hypothetical protein